MGARRGLSVALLLLGGAARLGAQDTAQADTAWDRYPVLATYGHLGREGEHVGLLSLEVLEVRPEGYGARFSVGSWLYNGINGVIETEAGVAGVIPIVPRLNGIATFGPMFAVGDGIVWGLSGSLGVLLEPVSPLVLRAAVGQHWFYLDGDFLKFTTWNVGAGIRLGPYARGGRGSTGAVH